MRRRFDRGIEEIEAHMDAIERPGMHALIENR
jgi:cold shock CspA family protein